MKPNLLMLATFAGVQFAFPAFAADNEATNSTGAAQSEIPALLRAGGQQLHGSGGD